MSGLKKKSKKSTKKKGVKYWEKKLIGNGGVVNDYVKYRDMAGLTGEGKPICPCFTCPAVVSGRNLHAGHWITRGKKVVAFDEHNIHPQCAACNSPWVGAGEPQKYEERLRLKYGDEEVDRIDLLARGPTKKWLPYELEALYEEYKKKLGGIK